MSHHGTLVAELDHRGLAVYRWSCACGKRSKRLTRHSWLAWRLFERHAR